MLSVLITVIISFISVFIIVGKVLSDFGPNDINRIKEIQKVVYTDIAIAAAVTAVFGFHPLVITLYHYMTSKFMLLSILNYNTMLEVDVD